MGKKQRTPKTGPSPLKVKSPAVKKEAAAPVVVSKEQVAEAEKKRALLQENIYAIEEQIYNIETRYLEQANPRGNAIKGFEGFLDLNRRVRRTPIKPEDRFFSSSSVTGTRHLQQPAAQQQQQPPSVQPPEGSQA